VLPFTVGLAEIVWCFEWCLQVPDSCGIAFCRGLLFSRRKLASLAEVCVDVFTPSLLRVDTLTFSPTEASAAEPFSGDALPSVRWSLFEHLQAHCCV
jgi:hypothetical protein